MNADGSGQTQPHQQRGDEIHPAWSPDGSQIAFTSVREGNLDIYVMNANGTGQANLSNNAVLDEDPAWQPVSVTSETDSDISITGAVTVGATGSDPAIALDLTGVGVDFDGGNPTGTLTQTYPSPPPNASVNVFHGDVSQGCVRVQGTRAVVVGHLPANEQFDVPNFGHIEWVGAFLEDNGVAGASPLDRAAAILYRTSSGTNACDPANANVWTTVANNLSALDAGDSKFTYTDHLDAYPSKPDAYFSVAGNPNGLSIAVTDELDPEGLAVAVGPGSGRMVLDVCATGKTYVAPNSTVIVTCGSLILEVVTGSAEVVLEDGLAVVSIPEGGVAEITEEPDGSFTVENQGTTPIEVTVDGETDTIEPGETDTVEAWDFQGFGLASPPALNKANAGSSAGVEVAHRGRSWCSRDGPVARPRFTVTNVDGTTGADLGNAQPGQTAGSLQNRGGGNYQLNWKTQKSWAAPCRAMHLDIGDGVTHDAYFKFR